MSSITEPGVALPDFAPTATSPALTLNLNSNNPFRNPRTNSPALLSPAFPSPHGAPAVTTPRLSPRPTATNPFLSDFEQASDAATQPPSTQPPIASSNMEARDAGVVRRSPVDSDAAQLFHRLTLLEAGPPSGAAPLTQNFSGPGHRSTRSGDDDRRRAPRTRPHPRQNQPTEELDIFASPEKQRERETRRARRNSESSILEKSSLTEAERKRRQMKHREREARSRDSRISTSSKIRGDTSKTRDGDASKTRRRKPRGMDLIDQLDQTGIYGAGLFHHDGPFDAVNPHRNRKRDTRAPMQAFPVNSANNTMGGSGPVNKNLDLERFHGVGAEGFTDYSSTFKRPAAERAISFDPTARVEPVHGEESIGLGTSTFLEGAPASRKAMQRRESETPDIGYGGGFGGTGGGAGGGAGAGGLGRKRSLAQRIRGISRPERPAQGLRSPEPRYGDQARGTANAPLSPPQQQSHQHAQSAGGPSRLQQSENNPFDTMYDEAYEKKGATIKIAEQAPVSSARRARAPSSPSRVLQRRITADGAEEEQKPAGGFLSRVKSLKGGRRRRES